MNPIQQEFGGTIKAHCIRICYSCLLPSPEHYINQYQSRNQTLCDDLPKLSSTAKKLQAEVIQLLQLGYEYRCIGSALV